MMKPSSRMLGPAGGILGLACGHRGGDTRGKPEKSRECGDTQIIVSVSFSRCGKGNPRDESLAAFSFVSHLKARGV